MPGEFSDPDDDLNMRQTRRFSDILRPNPLQPSPILNGDTKNDISTLDLQKIQQQQTLFYDVFERASNHSDNLSVATLYVAYNSILKESSRPQDVWVIRTLRRVCSQDGRSWEEKFRNLNDTYIKSVERKDKEERRAQEALNNAQANLVRRRNLLVSGFFKLKAEVAFRRKLTSLARKLHTKSLKGRYFHTMVTFNARLSRQQKLASMYRDRELKSGFLSIMRNTTQTVLQNNQVAHDAYVLKIMEVMFGWWRTKTRRVVRTQDIAKKFYSDILLSKCFSELQLGAAVDKLVNSRDKEMVKKVMEAWRWNAAQTRCEYHDAQLYYAGGLLRKYWGKMSTLKTAIDKHNLNAKRFYRANAFIKYFHQWKTSTHMVIQENTLVAKTNEVLAKNVLDSWRASLLLKLEAKRFRQHSLFHLGLKAFTLGLKTQAVKRRRGEDLKHRIVTMWRFKSRGRLTCRVNNGVMAKTILRHWRNVTADKVERRVVLFEHKTAVLHQKIASRFLNIWRDHLEDVAFDVARASNHHRRKLLTLGFGKMDTVANSVNDMYIEAEELCDRNLGKSFLRYWKSNMERKREARFETTTGELDYLRDDRIKQSAFLKWKEAIHRVQDQMAVAEDLFVEKDVLTMKEIFDHWRLITEQSRGLIEDAAEINDKRIMNSHFSSWLFKSQRAVYFNKAANDTRNKNLKRIQRQQVRKWRLRTLRMIQNQRTADDFQQKRDSRLMEPYFNKWLNKCRDKTGFGPALSETAVNFHEIRELHGFETPLRSSRRPPTSIRMSRLRQDPSTPRTLLAPLLRKQLDNANQQTI